MKKCSGGAIVGIVLFVFVLFPVAAKAIPHLGVIDTLLLETWDGSAGAFEGPFAYPGSGKITVFWGNESGPPPSVEIWLGTTAGSGFTFTFDSTVVDLNTSLTDPPGSYGTYGANYMGSLGIFSGSLPRVLASGALSLGHPLLDGGGEFWLLSGTFDGGTFPTEEFWIYAMADTGGNPGVFDNGKDEFSPKTFSSVPEPATLLLLGSGFLGLAILSRKRVRTRG